MFMVWDAIIPILLHSKMLKGSQDEFIPLLILIIYLQ